MSRGAPSFGRKQSAATNAEVVQKKWCAPNYLPYMFAAGVLLAVAGGVAIFDRNKLQLVSAIKPGYLDTVATGLGQEPLNADWDFSGERDEAISTTYWMAVNFRKLCNFAGFPVIVESDEEYQSANPDARNRYRVDVYGKEKSARQVVGLIQTSPSEFCGRDVHFAMFDYRVSALPLTLERSKERTEAILREGRRRLAEIENQSAVYDSGGPSEPYVDVPAFCREKWPTDLEMQAYCRRQQDEARDRVSARHADTPIMRFCASRWPGDWEMFDYCLGNQVKAQRELN